eukprot:Lankesteria_metandrocarpae@DN4862_c0_g1_i1.p1
MYSKQLEVFSKRCAELLLKMRDSEPTKSRRRKASQVEEVQEVEPYEGSTKRRQLQERSRREKVKQRLVGEIDDMLLMDRSFDLTEEAILQSLNERDQWSDGGMQGATDILMTLPVIGRTHNQSTTSDEPMANAAAKSKKAGGRFLEESPWSLGDVEELHAAPSTTSFHHLYDMDFDFQDQLSDEPLISTDTTVAHPTANTTTTAVVPLEGISFDDSQGSNENPDEQYYSDEDSCMSSRFAAHSNLDHVSEDHILTESASALASTLLQDDSQQSHSTTGLDFTATDGNMSAAHHGQERTSPWQVLLSAERGRGGDDRSHALNVEAYMESELAGGTQTNALLKQQHSTTNVGGSFMDTTIPHGNSPVPLDHMSPPQGDPADVLDVLANDNIDLTPPFWDDKDMQEEGLLSANSSRPATASRWRLSDVSSAASGMAQYIDSPSGAGEGTATLEDRIGNAPHNPAINNINPPMTPDPRTYTAAVDDGQHTALGDGNATAQDTNRVAVEDAAEESHVLDIQEAAEEGLSSANSSRLTRKRRRIIIRGSANKDEHSTATDVSLEQSNGLESPKGGSRPPPDAISTDNARKTRRGRAAATVAHSRGLQIIVDTVTIVGDDFWQQTREALETPQLDFADDEGHSIRFLESKTRNLRSMTTRGRNTIQPMPCLESVSQCGRLTGLTRCQRVATAVAQYNEPKSAALSELVQSMSNRGEAFHWTLSSFLHINRVKKSRCSARPFTVSTIPEVESNVRHDDSNIIDIYPSPVTDTDSPLDTDLTPNPRLVDDRIDNTEVQTFTDSSGATADAALRSGYGEEPLQVQQHNSDCDGSTSGGEQQQYHTHRGSVNVSTNEAVNDCGTTDRHRPTTDDDHPHCDSSEDVECSATIDTDLTRDSYYRSIGPDTGSSVFDYDGTGVEVCVKTPGADRDKIVLSTLPIDEDEMMWFLESHPSPFVLSESLLSTPEAPAMLQNSDKDDTWCSQGLSFATATPSVNFYNHRISEAVCGRPQRLLLLFKKRSNIQRAASLRRLSSKRRVRDQIQGNEDGVVNNSASDTGEASDDESLVRSGLCFQDLLKNSGRTTVAIAFFDLLVLSCQGAVKVEQLCEEMHDQIVWRDGEDRSEILNSQKRRHGQCDHNYRINACALSFTKISVLLDF